MSEPSFAGTVGAPVLPDAGLGFAGAVTGGLPGAGLGFVAWDTPPPVIVPPHPRDFDPSDFNPDDFG